jgi:TrmH family RNA methyltransferase
MTPMPSPTSTELTSPANPRVKSVRALRDRGERDRSGLTLIDGARELRRALDARVAVEEAYVCDRRLAGPDARATLDGLVRARVPIVHVNERVLGILAFGDRSDGIVAVARIPSTDLADLDLPTDPLVVVIEGVEKPGNVGAVMRSADGAGADAVVAASPRTDLFNPNAIRASAGTVFGVPLASAPTPVVIGWLRANGIRIVAARVDAAVTYTDADLRGPIALVLGAESDGLTEAWADPRVEAVRIPMLGHADSLNVSVSAAILLYEARRQRGLPAATEPQPPDVEGE